MTTEIVLLNPRPLARSSGRLLLLPLLPERPHLKPLPSEVWSKIFIEAIELTSERPNSGSKEHFTPTALTISRVCKSFKEIAVPVLYSHVRINKPHALDKLTTILRDAEQKWDSIRRIPYSAPGRWVQTVDLSALSPLMQPADAFIVDSLLTTLFPLLPFLSALSLCPQLPLSRRALASLANREDNSHIRVLEGICYDASYSSEISTDRDPIVQLLSSCPGLETLELSGQGFDPIELDLLIDHAEDLSPPTLSAPLNLPALQNLTLLSIPFCSTLLALLLSPLPSLRRLTVTPYDDIPYPASLVTTFLEAHGRNLSSLLLYTPKVWPTRLRPTPNTILHTSPRLRHLSLEYPLPTLNLPSGDVHTSEQQLPLEILSIPRPNAEFWRRFERLLPHFPALKAVRARDVRWLRSGMTSRAQEAGVQGEMREWRRRLALKGVKLLDGDWNEMH